MRERWTSAFPWRSGNRVAVLENGEEFFARVFAAIEGAQHEVLIETFILFEDKIGLELQRRLIAAAQRGVKVEITADGFGSPQFSAEFLSALSEAGVKLRVFDPQPRWLGMRLNVFRRMHRKLVVADERVALVGGINYSADHVMDFGAEAKQDYAVVIEGPVVADIHSFLRVAMSPPGTGEAWQPPRGAESAPAGSADVMFALRDNHRHTKSIELEYRRAIRAARSEIVIANAYFFPGYGFLRDLRHAARRGVKVSLIFQGEPDTKVALAAARSLYRYLVDAGIGIYEYCQRPFHGKIALIDNDWATVGSSNLDPLSLSLNLEANVFIRNAEFAADLRSRMNELMQRHCRLVDAESVPRGRFWHALVRPLLFHCLRRFPAWAGWLPAHTPHITLAKPPVTKDDLPR